MQRVFQFVFASLDSAVVRVGLVLLLLLAFLMLIDKPSFGQEPKPNEPKPIALSDDDKKTVQLIGDEIQEKRNNLIAARGKIEIVEFECEKVLKVVADAKLAASEYREVLARSESLLNRFRLKYNCSDCLVSNDGASLVKPATKK